MKFYKAHYNVILVSQKKLTNSHTKAQGHENHLLLYPLAVLSMFPRHPNPKPQTLRFILSTHQALS